MCISDVMNYILKHTMIWEIFIYTVNVVHMLNIHSNNFHGSVKAACILKMSLAYLAKGTHMYITICILHIMEMTTLLVVCHHCIVVNTILLDRCYKHRGGEPDRNYMCLYIVCNQCVL